jgi:hypothetical protein
MNGGVMIGPPAVKLRITRGVFDFSWYMQMGLPPQTRHILIEVSALSAPNSDRNSFESRMPHPLYKKIL